MRKLLIWLLILAAMPAAAQRPHLDHTKPVTFGFTGGMYGLGRLTTVGILVEGLRQDGALRTGLTVEALETRLKAAIIRSRTVSLSETNDWPKLYLNVNLLPLTSMPCTVCNTSLGLDQDVLLPVGNDLSWCLATTWHTGSVSVAPDGEVAMHVRNTISELVDEFAVEWAKENPPKQD